MKVSINLFLLLIVSIYIQAQKFPTHDIKDYIQSGWDVQNCSFDPDADAIVLFKESTYDFIMSSNIAYMEVRHKRVLKVLNQDGLESATHEHRYYSYRNREIIKFIKGTVYNKDENGKVTEQAIEKDNIFNTKETEYHSIFKIAPPNVKEGSIVYIEYTFRTPNFPKHFYQEKLPVAKSVLQSSFENDLQMNISNHVTYPMKQMKDYRGNRNYYYIEVDSLTGLSTEPYQHNMNLYVQKTNMIPMYYNTDANPIKLTPNMGNVLHAYLSDDNFRRKFNSDVTNVETNVLLEQAKGLKDDLEKAKLIYNFIINNFESTESDNIMLDKTLATVLRDKKGTHPELSALLLKLLQKLDLNATIFLTTKNDEAPFEMDWPSINDFTTIVVLLKIGDQEYFLNPIYKSLPFGYVPRNLIASRGVEISTMKAQNASYAYKTIQNKSKNDFRSTNIISSIDDKGMIKGSLFTNYLEYSNVDFVYAVKKDSTAFFDNLKKEQSLSKIGKVEINNVTENNTTLKLDFNRELIAQDDYIFLPLNIFTDFSKNEFISTFRKTGVWFGTPLNRKMNFVITIPETYTVEELPKNMRFTNEDKSILFSRKVIKQDNTLNIQVEFLVSKILFGTEEYPMFYEFWKLIYEQLNENIAIKRG